MLGVKTELKELLMKQVGVISDTHVPTRATKIPSRVFEVFQSADFIIHAGDLVELEVIDVLEELAPVIPVHGNMDGIEIRKKIPQFNEVKIFKWRIGVIHDPGTLFGRKIREIAEEHEYDVMIYGHTHRPSLQWEKNRLFMNPGSPTNPLPPFITKPSVAILTLTGEKVHPEIISLR